MLLLVAPSAHAGITVEEDLTGKYVKKNVSAESVKRVEIFLVTEVVRNDCNHRTLVSSSKLVFREGNGHSDTYSIDAQISITKMHCPLETPVRETIRSPIVSFLPSN